MPNTYYSLGRAKRELFLSCEGEQVIYTHVTIKGFDKIKNPLDDLDI